MKNFTIIRIMKNFTIMQNDVPKAIVRGIKEEAERVALKMARQDFEKQEAHWVSQARSFSSITDKFDGGPVMDAFNYYTSVMLWRAYEVPVYRLADGECLIELTDHEEETS